MSGFAEVTSAEPRAGVRGGTWRAAARLLVVAGWSMVSAAGLTVVPAVWLASPAMGHRTRLGLFHGWARGMTRILGVRLTVEGERPAPPFLLVTNHLSYLDVIVLAACAPGRFVAKREVRSWPMWGFLAWAVGTIFVDRGMRRDSVRVNARIRAALARAEGVILFAEGTSTAGDRVHPLKAALLAPATDPPHPVRYAGLTYRVPDGAPPARFSVCWWGEMEFGPHVLGLLGLPAIAATVRFGPEPVIERDRKLLAQRLHQAIVECFTPVDSPGADAAARP